MISFQLYVASILPPVVENEVTYSSGPLKLDLGEVENRVQEVKGTLWRNNEKWINNELIFIPPSR